MYLNNPYHNVDINIFGRFHIKYSEVPSYRRTLADVYVIYLYPAQLECVPRLTILGSLA